MSFKKHLLNVLKNISTTKSIQSIPKNSLVILALPTNYDELNDSFDTSALETVISDLFNQNPNITILIKSTIPVGFTKKMIKRFNSSRLFFSPEFLREGRSFYDATNPERIIISPQNPIANDIAKTFLSITNKFDKRNLLIMQTDEAESVKLFANTYLAMRVAFINEIDSFCLHNNLNTEDVILGISKDSRIGEGYNNPSFGFGGYCFPKDTKQARSTFKDIPQSLISAIVSSNEIRASYLVERIIQAKKKVIGFYRLNVKSNSDNIRDSSSLNLLKKLIEKNHEIVVYEPLGISDGILSRNVRVINTLSEFLDIAEIIIANRVTNDLSGCMDKVFTRDVFCNN